MSDEDLSNAFNRQINIGGGKKGRKGGKRSGGKFIEPPYIPGILSQWNVTTSTRGGVFIF